MMKKKKNARERRVLVGAVVVAGVMVAGSTFAWFTSQDEVTNRLSASAAYNVTIAEDFTPPENWVPGQKIDKNVGAVNTGNTDAFVRMWLEGEMRMIAQGASTTTASSMSSPTPALEAVTDQQLLDVNLTYKIGDVYLRELDKTKLIQNPNTSVLNASSPQAYTEVMAAQAGGELAYVADGTSYKFKPNQTLNVVSGNGVQIQLVKDTEYTVTVDNALATDNMSLSGTTLTLKSLADFRTIDSNTFTPVTDGLYLFKRNVDLGTNDDYEFGGYYVKKIGTEQHYFALEYDTTGTQRSDAVLADGVVTPTIGTDNNYTITDVSNVKMFAASQETIANADLTWTLMKGVENNGVIYTTADNGTTWKKGTVTLDSTNDATLIATLNSLTKFDMFQVKRTSGAGNGVLINIALSNIGDTAEKWKAITDTGKTTTFYYTNDLEEGASTAQLVDSLTMDSTVTQNDYVAFDFDLNVLMESVQVTVDENGVEGFDTVSPWAAGSTNVAATGTNGTGSPVDGEITVISWAIPTV